MLVLAEAVQAASLGLVELGQLTLTTGALIVVVVLWRRLEKLQDGYLAKVEQLLSAHAIEQKATLERYHEAARSLAKALDQLTDAINTGNGHDGGSGPAR